MTAVKFYAASIPRELLARAFGDNPRLITAFEEQALTVEKTAEATESTVGATEALQDATVLVLSPNGAFTNERVLKLGVGLAFDLSVPGEATVKADGLARTRDYPVTFVAAGASTLFLPVEGTLLSREKIGDGLGNYASDAAAAGGGVPLGGLYHNAGVLHVRIA